jgi:hypothetical protein
VSSDRLFFDAMAPDAQGIPVQRSRTFSTYNPAYVAWYGLMDLERAARRGDAAPRTFLRQVDWLANNVVRDGDGAAVWPYTVEVVEGDCVLVPPWISAMAQGLAISLLVRGYRVTRQSGLLDLCHAATRVFEKSVEDGGLRSLEHGGALYEEYPAYPLPRVLDGFLFSLLGLYDLSVETDEAGVSALFMQGMAGLKHTLKYWSYRDKWSWYGSHGYLCPPHYHRLNTALIDSLGRLTKDGALVRCARDWDPRRLTMAGRAEIFAVFLLTKNLSRLRHRTWRRRSPWSGTPQPARAKSG